MIMYKETQNNKRIVKNTLFLYFRMFITMLVGLYTSRVVLSTLGFSDYGIYNVVGGIVALFAFINNAMVASSQRFISYELGTKCQEKLNIIYSTTKIVHSSLALIIALFAEIIGYYLLNYKLNIPVDRLTAANWVLHSTIIVFVLNVISVPQRAVLVAHERMDYYAYVSIVEVVLKLGIVYILKVVPHDKLIIYSVLLVLVSLIIIIILRVYVYIHFEECRSKLKFDRIKFYEMFKFALWSLVGNLGFSTAGHISNMFVNVFCGTTINAARGIAIQVNGIISNFSAGFITAINPQITQSYASNDIWRSINLVYSGAKYSFFLLSLVVIPLIVNIDYVLKVWLVEVPPYTSIFVVCTLISTLLYSMSDTVTYALQATGDIKLFQIIICIVYLLEVPIVYLFLYNGVSPKFVLLPTIFSNLIALVSRIIILRKQVSLYSIKFYLFSIVCKNIFLFAISVFISIFIKNILGVSLISLLLVSILSVVISISIFYLFGLNRNEKEYVLNIIKKKFSFSKR